MTQYNTLNVKLFNSQLNKLKSRKKVTLKLSSNAVGDSNNENNSPQKLLVTKTQVSRRCKYFANGSSTNIKFNYEKKWKLNCINWDNH